MLEKMFYPASVAVIGASQEKGKVGRAVLDNLIDGFKGNIYPINPKSAEIEGIKCYKSVLNVPGDIDLAVIVIPAKLVPTAVKECGEKGIKNLVIISAGFKEVGPEGARLENEIKDIAKNYGIRIVGPNCLGIINTYSGCNASFAKNMPPEGQHVHYFPVRRAGHGHPRLVGDDRHRVRQLRQPGQQGRPERDRFHAGVAGRQGDTRSSSPTWRASPTASGSCKVARDSVQGEAHRRGQERPDERGCARGVVPYGQPGRVRRGLRLPPSPSAACSGRKLWTSSSTWPEAFRPSPSPRETGLPLSPMPAGRASWPRTPARSTA